MAKEIISRGNPFEVEHVDRAFGGARTMALRVDDESGDVQVHGAPINGAAQVLVATKKLTSTQILSLNSSPIEVIPAPPAGKFIEVVSVHARLTWGNSMSDAAYSSVGASDFLQLKYTDGSGSLLTANFSPVGVFDQAADGHQLLTAVSGSVPKSAKVVAVLAGAWTLGTSPITLEVLYRLRDLGI
jgi:hypothetical protein